MVKSASRLLTIDDLDRMPENGALRELVHGELREWLSPTFLHGLIELGLGALLREFVVPRKLGYVMSGEVRFLIKGDRSRARLADVAFVAASKFPGGELPDKTDATEPDFIAEIVSPDDTATMVDEKVEDWFEAGARLIWLVYPKTKHVIVCLPDGTSTTIPHGGVLDGRDVFPGLRLPVASFLP